MFRSYRGLSPLVSTATPKPMTITLIIVNVWVTLSLMTCLFIPTGCALVADLATPWGEGCGERLR